MDTDGGTARARGAGEAGGVGRSGGWEDEEEQEEPEEQEDDEVWRTGEAAEARPRDLATSLEEPGPGPVPQSGKHAHSLSSPVGASPTSWSRPVLCCLASGV